MIKQAGDRVTLNEYCLKLDKLNAFAMINGYENAGEHIYQAIYCAKGPKTFPMLITLAKTKSPYKPSAIADSLDYGTFSVAHKYVAILDSEYFIENSHEFWGKACSNSLFDIWAPESPYKFFTESKKDPLQHRILLLRVFEIEEAFLPEEVRPKTTYYDQILRENREVVINRPVIEDEEFDRIKLTLKKITNENSKQEHKSISSYMELQKRIKEWSNAYIEGHKNALDVASLTGHWYYSPIYDTFGPLKFIGYKSIKIDEYMSEDLDGRETESAIEKLNDYMVLQDSNPNSKKYNKRLDNFLSAQKKVKRVTAKIHISERNALRKMMFYLHQANEIFSYKWVMLKALLDSTDDNSKSTHEHFWEFYRNRKIDGFPVEKEGSAVLTIDLETFQRSQLSSILDAPFQAINNSSAGKNIIVRENSEYRFDHKIVNELPEYRDELIAFIEFRINQYFDKTKTVDRNVWWVNQGKTYTQERAGGFIWAPITNKQGNSVSHWDSMVHVNKGDIVISYSKKKIVAISIAKEKAYNYENELSDQLWERAGRQIDLSYHELTNPILLQELQPLMQGINQTLDKNKPFNSVNGINQGYLFGFSVGGIKQITEKFRDRIPSEILKILGEEYNQLSDAINGAQQMDFLKFLEIEGFHFSGSQIKNFVLSLKTKQFVILTGNSGTGKTKLAQLYARYIGSLKPDVPLSSFTGGLIGRKWFKLSFNDKAVVQSFQGTGKKIDQIRQTILNEGLMSLGWLDNEDDREPKQKEMMKDLKPDDVIVAYQGGFIIGGIGLVEQPHFFDDRGDAFEAFNESTKNFIRVNWLFKGPLRIKDFQFEEYKVPGFGMWVDTIHQLSDSHVERFLDYLIRREVNLSEATLEKPKSKYALIPVGANWTDKRHLLGYHNVITERYQETKTLKLILEAQKAESKGRSTPFFLILDEMNLSHVERYFSDFLSALESAERIPLHDSDEIEQEHGVPKELGLPKNLYVIGTVNVDETTYMFSPKVLDRANVIEFNTASALKYLSGDLFSGNSKNLPVFPGEKSNGDLTPAKIFKKMEEVNIQDNRTNAFTEKISHEINTFQRALRKIGFDFGFRVTNEIILYMYLAWEADGKQATWDKWVDAFDAQIVQKMLPKVHGSAKVVGDMLKCLYCLCFAGKTQQQVEKLCSGEVVLEIYNKDLSESRYSKSAKKLKKMQTSIETQRYVSFT